MCNGRTTLRGSTARSPGPKGERKSQGRIERWACVLGFVLNDRSWHNSDNVRYSVAMGWKADIIGSL
jgi:hypothetical protein